MALVRVEGPARLHLGCALRAGPRGFEEMSLLDWHGVGRDLKPQRACIEAAWRVGEAGIHADQFGTGVNLARGKLDRAGAVACVAGDAVERLSFYVAMCAIEIG